MYEDEVEACTETTAFDPTRTDAVKDPPLEGGPNAILLLMVRLSVARHLIILTIIHPMTI
jgi:hypothetical protein